MCSWPIRLPPFSGQEVKITSALPSLVQIGHHRLAGKANAAAGHIIRPVAMLGFVQPVGVDSAVVGGVENLLEAVAVQVGHHGIGDTVLNDVIVLGERAAAGAGRGQHGPVEAAAAPAGAVELENPGQMVQVAVRVADSAVVHVADDDDLGHAVAVHVGDRRGAVGEVGPVLGAAVGVAAQIGGLVHVDADLAPHLGALRVEIVIDRVGRELVAVAVQSGDVVGVGRADDLLEAIAVQVGHGDVLVVHAPAIARFAVVPGRPAWAHRAIGFIDVELFGRPAAGPAHNNL